MKTWFITGASSGFGQHLAEVAAEKGDKVYATARTPSKLDELQAKHPDNIVVLQLDVTDQASVDAAAAKAENVDILVNNAGIGAVGAIEETSIAQAQQLFDVNVWGLTRVTQAFLPHFREQRSGHIINISSVAGLFTMPGFGFYCASKHAVEALTDGLAGELAAFNVHVTSVEPGAFNTNFAGGGNVLEAPNSGNYEESAGQTRAFLEQFADGGAQGDPRKAAEHMYAMTELSEIPRRLPLGEDAWEWVGQRMDELKAQVTANEQLTRGTNYE